MYTKCLGVAPPFAAAVSLLGYVSPAFAAPPVCPGDHPSCKEGGPGDDSQQLTSASCQLLADPGHPNSGIYSDGNRPYINLEQGVQCTIENAEGRHKLATPDDLARHATVRFDVDTDCGVWDNGHPEKDWSFDGEAKIAIQTDSNLRDLGQDLETTDIETWIHINDGTDTGPRRLQYGGTLKGVSCGAAPTISCDVADSVTGQCVAWTIDARSGQPCFRGPTGPRAVAYECQVPFFETVTLIE